MSLYHRGLADFSDLPGPFRATFWIVCGGGTFVLMMAIARHLAGELHMLPIVLWRAVFGVAFMMPWLARCGIGVLRTDKIAFHGVRTLSNCGGLLFTFCAATIGLGQSESRAASVATR